ncbi:MAG: histidine kinase [Cyanobacteriota bacterium]|nr:histidine kinase [Cyanobacteriota bacterium]
MPTSPEPFKPSEAPLQLLLFVDRRPSSWEQLRQVREYLKEKHHEVDWELEAVEVGDKPYLVEHFKLVATPALVKIHPEPQQTLTGSDLVEQLTQYWPRWKHSVENYLKQARASSPSATDASENPRSSIASSAQIIQLSDEIFQLKQEKEALQEQLRFNERLISMLAHEIRNPLTATSMAIDTLDTVGYDNLLEGKKLTHEQFHSLIKLARTQTRAIDRMIGDILQASRGETKLRIQPKQVDLGSLCSEVLEEQRERLEAKSLQLETDIPKDLPYAYADLERVRQVLMNLLDNAGKYTPEGGQIGVSVLHRTSQKIQIGISDTGPGIPSEEQQSIFEDEFRLKRDRSKDGYGIGLALCERIVRSHYGRIWVDSVPGRGSTFYFTLPVYRS